VCLGRARALAAAGRTDEAFGALRCALEGGVPAGLVREDPYLSPLRSDPRWAALMSDSAPGAPGGPSPPGPG
ncbi:MAG TPA: hypothetical protein VKA44_00990, partial [Gemmatimonadota bacterium]|nr:hypothetical protein [Gemmatimonadota bacterium]